MKKYVLALISQAEDLLKKADVTRGDIDELERHIDYCRHERLVHLLVTLAFAIMTMITLVMCVFSCGIAVMLLLLLFAVMTAAYVWHYYFLENSVQKLYIISDKMHARLK